MGMLVPLNKMCVNGRKKIQEKMAMLPFLSSMNA